MKVMEKIMESKGFFERCGIEEPMKEAETLIRHALGMDAVSIYRDNSLLDKEDEEIVNEMLRRRARREPLQYIIGYVNFLGLRIMVGEGVLIPRPETEIMAEQAIKRVTSYKLKVTGKNKNSSLNILDLCTGSGCLALALAMGFQDSYVYGSDISRVAIRYATRNAHINRIKNVRFIVGDLFKPFKNSDLFDLIISNPPYIRTEEIRRLQPEIRQWEPIKAIDGGWDGLEFYRRIIPGARRYLKYDGILIMEIGAGGLPEIIDMFKNSGYEDLEVLNDYAGVERIIMARWKS